MCALKGTTGPRLYELYSLGSRDGPGSFPLAVLTNIALLALGLGLWGAVLGTGGRGVASLAPSTQCQDSSPASVTMTDVPRRHPLPPGSRITPGGDTFRKQN